MGVIHRQIKTYILYIPIESVVYRTTCSSFSLSSFFTNKFQNGRAKLHKQNSKLSTEKVRYVPVPCAIGDGRDSQYEETMLV